MEIIGWIGSALLAGCAAPQAIKSWRDGRTAGISDAMLWSWLMGEILMCAYVVATGCNPPLLANYAANIALLCIIMKFRYWPTKSGPTAY